MSPSTDRAPFVHRQNVQQNTVGDTVITSRDCSREYAWITLVTWFQHMKMFRLESFVLYVDLSGKK